MTAVVEVARISYSEAIRNRVFYAALLFLLMLLLVAAALATVTMGRTELMVSDIGLAGISFLGNVMAIVLTIQSMQQERDNHTLYVLLTRLSKRWQYILGKYLGLLAVIGVQVLGMSVLLALFVAALGSIGWASFVQACAATLIEVALVVGMAMLFAQTSSLFLGVALTLSTDIAGRFTSIMRQFGAQSDSAVLHYFTEAAYYVLPNLEAVNLRPQAGYIASYAGERFFAVVGYGLLEAAVLVLLAALIFQRRDLS